LKALLATMLVAAIAIAAIVSGCGSDDDSTSSSAASDSSSLSKAEFVKQANAACLGEREDSLEELATYQQRHRSEGLPEAVLAENAFKAVTLSTIEAEIAALRALGLPTGDDGGVEAILALLQADLDKATKLRAKLSSDEVEGYFVNANKKLRGYGLSSCTKAG
jgi:hypothetical protein